MNNQRVWDENDNLIIVIRKRTVKKIFKLSVLLLFLSIIGALILKTYIFVTYVPDLPPINTKAWWGPEDKKICQDTSIRPYRIVFPDSLHQLLNKKFHGYRTKNHVKSYNGTYFSYGFHSDTLEDVLNFWMFKYDIKERQSYFNQYNNFLTNIDGLDIHFIHVKPKVNKQIKVYPILLLHGWPGSIKEFYEVIPHLTKLRQNCDFVFEIILPSLPGFGYSQAPIRPGLDPYHIAIIMHKLMKRIGFDQYYIHGGDFGHIIASNMVTLFPDEILGYHTNLVLHFGPVPDFMQQFSVLWPALLLDHEYHEKYEKYATVFEETKYAHAHMTKPDTLGISLQDSPVGLAAFILEKFVIYTDPANKMKNGGGLFKNYSITDLLDNVMIYWFTNCITTSMRLFVEILANRDMEEIISRIPTTVPTWGLRMKHELIYQPDIIFSMKYTNYIGSTNLDMGGHFAALEMPETLADDIVKAVQAFNNPNGHHQQPLSHNMNNSDEMFPSL